MRMMVKFQIPVASGNEGVRTGKIAKVMKTIMSELKPEAAYFYTEAGERTGFMVIDMQESSQVAGVAELFFQGLNAGVEMTPVMSAEDLEKALSGVEATI
jgi:N-acetylmuramic acid 6-phosphate (MurNAc-6-P) etherase